MKSATSATKNFGKGNTNCQNSQSRKWCLTINNYTTEDFEKVRQECATKKWNYIIGKEKGEKGTIHLQIYIETKTSSRFTTIKKMFPKAHIEKAKGKRDVNLKYCSKEGNFDTNFKDPLLFQIKLENEILEEEYGNVTWYEWQQNILDIIEQKPDNRSIYIIIDKEGNKGKSFLCKYIAIKYKGVLICEGKKNDIFNQIKSMMDECITPKIVLVDVPRSSKDFLNYGTIECIKNGLIYSGKYEGGKCVFKCPHVFIFMNECPTWGSMSMDRWKETYI